MAQDRGSMDKQQNVGRLAELINKVKVAWYLFVDDRVSPAVKAIPLVGLLYLLWPIDLLPDLFPVLGQLDDIAVLLLALNWFIQACPSDIVEEIRYGDRDTISARYTVVDDHEPPQS